MVKMTPLAGAPGAGRWQVKLSAAAQGQEELAASSAVGKIPSWSASAPAWARSGSSRRGQQRQDLHRALLLQGWGSTSPPGNTKTLVASAWLGQTFAVKWNPYAGVTLNETLSLITALSSLFPSHCLRFYIYKIFQIKYV